MITLTLDHSHPDLEVELAKQLQVALGNAGYEVLFGRSYTGNPMDRGKGSIRIVVTDDSGAEFDTCNYCGKMITGEKVAAGSQSIAGLDIPHIACSQSCADKLSNKVSI